MLKAIGFAYLIGLFAVIFYKQHLPSLHVFYVILNIGFVMMLGLIILAGGVYIVTRIPGSDDMRWHSNPKSEMIVDLDIR